MKTIDRTYGHLVAGADTYERELLDAFDSNPRRLDAIWTRRTSEMPRSEGPRTTEAPRLQGFSEERERRDSNPRPPA